MKTILIVGSTSEIAQATAEEFAKNGWNLILAARDEKKNSAIKSHLITKYGINAYTIHYDAAHHDESKSLLDMALGVSAEVNAVLISHGVLPNQEEIEGDTDKIASVFKVNSLSVIEISELTAQYFEKRMSGTLAVISSVAGDRGRQSNYIYGASKSVVSTYYQGLRNRLYKSGVSVVTIKPGFVDTAMTADIQKNALFASPESVGKSIYKAMIKKKNIVYLPWFWRYIILIVKSVPETIFKRLKL